MSKSSGKRFSIQRQPYVAALLVASVVAVVSFGAFTLLKNLYPKANRAKADTAVNTGKGRVTAVDLTQVGTGASVTIDNSNQTVDGKSLDETTYGTNTTRRTVLNNNIVRYRVKYEVTTPGTVTLQFTMPANSVIDKASIASCADGSAMTSATTDNLHADINKGWGGYSEASKPEESHSYNQATCVMNYDMAGTYTWDISTRPWGGNGEKIVPEVKFNGEMSTANAEVITIAARAGRNIIWSGSSLIMGSNGDGDAKLSFILMSEKTDDYSLGIEPLSDNIEVPYSLTSTIKNATSWKRSRIVDGVLLHGKTSQGVQWDVPYSGITNTKINGGRATVGLRKVVTGASSCETRYAAGYCVWGEYDYDFYFNLTQEEKKYSQTVAPLSVLTRSGLTTNLTSETFSQSRSLSKHGEANPFAWYLNPAVGQETACMYGEIGSTCPVYRGEMLDRMIGLNGVTVPGKSYAEANYFCVTWNKAEVALDSDLSTVDDDARVEYGVIGDETNDLPSSSERSCGVYNDGNKTFTKEAANQKVINAIRLLVPKIEVADGQRRIAQYQQKVISSKEHASSNEKIYFLISGHSPDWSVTRDGNDTDNPYSWLYAARYSVVVPGLLTSSKPVVSISQVHLNDTATISVTPITYNNDADAAMTFTIPKGLTFVDGTLKQGDATLTSGDDYTVTNGDDGTTTIKITGKSIAGTEPTEVKDSAGNVTDVVAADNGGQGVSHTPISLTVRADADVVTPQTLTVGVATSGNGTDMTYTGFHQKSVDISVVDSKTFTYGLSASSDSIHSGDSITYMANIRNSLDEATDDDGATLVNVLPFNGDSRGTVGLDSYTVKDISLAATNTGSSEAPTADIYYTTSLDDAKKIDGVKDAAAMKAAVDSTKWTKCELSGGKCTPNLSDGEQIRAAKIRTGKLSKNDSVIMRYTLGDIYSTDSAAGTDSVATIGNDVSYAVASLIDTGVHTFGGKIADLGDQMGLSLDKTNVALSVTPGSTSTAALSGTIDAKVNKGYTLAVTPPAEMKGAKDGHSFKKLNITPDREQ